MARTVGYDFITARRGTIDSSRRPRRILGSLRLISAAQADRLDEIRKAGVHRVAAFDSNRPFGVPAPATKRVAGLDVDYAQAIADTIGVTLEMRPTNPAIRIPLVTPGKVDLVLASFTSAEERAGQVDFGIPYFAFDQQFLAKEGHPVLIRALERPARRRREGHHRRDRPAPRLPEGRGGRLR